MEEREKLVDEIERHDVEDARRGDRDAFDRLVIRYGRRVLSVAWGIVRNAADAEDLAQEAFVRSWRKIEEFDPARAFGPWICTIVTRLAIDLVRRRKRWAFEQMDRSGDPVCSARTDRPLNDAEIARRIDESIESLPEMQRIVARLHLVEDFTISEIAEMTDLVEGTVRSHLSHARTRLKKALEDLR